MDFDLSEDQEALRASARELLRHEASSSRVRAVVDRDDAEGDRIDRRLWQHMVDQGWVGVAVAETDGGLGLGMIEAAILAEELGRRVAPAPLLPQLLALGCLASGSRGPSLLDGSVVAAVTHRSLTLVDSRVSGATEPVPYLPIADILVATTDDDRLVAVELAETDRTTEPAMDRTRPVGRVELEGVPATVVAEGQDAVGRFRSTAAMLTSAELLGVAGSALELSVAYASEREQFGQPIGSFQAVKHRCADMLVDVEAMRSAVFYAAWAIGANADDADEAASMAKAWCSDAGLRVTQSALQVHGGIGFTWESDVHLLLKRAQLDAMRFGDARHHRRLIAAGLAERRAD